jgi:regulator of cell morphogenesis and NO signaling
MLAVNTKTIGEIVAGTPLAARVFERHHIDYCCGGNHALDEVCRQAGLEVEAILGEIEQETGRVAPADIRDWTTASLAQLIDHILTTHHAYLSTALPRIGQIIARVSAAHGTAHPEVIVPLANVFGILRQELEVHMKKEEIILFPAIVRLEGERRCGRKPPREPFGSVERPIHMMEHEHAVAGRALSDIRSLTNGFTPPVYGCNTFRVLYEELRALEADLHLHIHLENNILFPRAARMEAFGIEAPRQP